MRMRHLRTVLVALLGATAATSSRAQVPVEGGLLAAPKSDPAIAAALSGISAEHVQADIAKLVSFGTRNTLSSICLLYTS